MSWEGLKPWWGAQFLQPLPGVIYILWFPHMSTLVGNYLHPHTHTRASHQSHFIISYHIASCCHKSWIFLNHPDTSWHHFALFWVAKLPFFLDRECCAWGCASRRCMGAKRDWIAGWSWMILDALIQPSFPAYCIILHLIVACLAYFFKVYAVFAWFCMSLHVFAFSCSHLASLALGGLWRSNFDCLPTSKDALVSHRVPVC